MSRILKRPMFRIGGSANNEGIMSGVVPKRAGYAEPQGAASTLDNYQLDTSSDLYKNAIRNAAILSQFAGTGRSQSDRLSDLLISGGLNLMSARPSGNIFSTAAGAFKEPTAQYLKAQETEDAFKRQIRLAGATQAMQTEEAERLARIKLADDLKKVELAKEELFYKSPIGVALGSSAKTVFDTLKQYDKEGIPYYAKPFNINTNTKKLDITGLDAVPVGIKFFDINGKFYERTEKGYKEVYGKSGQDVVPITVEKKPGFFESVKEKGAAYDPRSWNKQKFYESLLIKNKANME